MKNRLMSWSSDFTKDVPTLSMPVGDQVAVFEPDEAAVAHHLLSEFLRDCAIHRRAPGAIRNQQSPDWGHGPNRPVNTYTEDQIRDAFVGAGERAAEQLIETLREDRIRARPPVLQGD